MSVAKLEKVICSDSDESSCSSSYSDSYSASESEDDSVLSVSHSISSRTRGKNMIQVVALNMVYILQQVVIQILEQISL